jgi:hypothetical protein
MMISSILECGVISSTPRSDPVLDAQALSTYHIGVDGAMEQWSVGEKY